MTIATTFKSPFTCPFVGVVILAFATLIGTAGRTWAVIIVDEDFETGAVGSTLDMLTGWSNPGIGGGGQIIDEDGVGGNKFVTTAVDNNSASRFDLSIVNPGFGPGTTLIMTMDVWDPLVNSQSSVNSFPRAVGGILDLDGAASMPAYFGIEQIAGDSGIAEWMAAGENFVRSAGATDAVGQDTWYTVRAVWNLGAETMNVSAKTRDGADPFVAVVTGASTPFVDASQDLGALDVWRQRLNRGTRIDNVLVDAVPEPASASIAALAGVIFVGFRRRKSE